LTALAAELLRDNHTGKNGRHTLLAQGSGPILVDRRHTWALGEAVQWSNASGDVSTATAFRLGRMCDLATHQCAP